MKLQPLLPGLLLTGTVAVLVAQPAWAQVTQVTDLQLKPTPTGLEVILDTADGATPQIFTSASDQTLILDVSNAQLSLRSGKEFFRAFKPVAGIAEVTATNLNANSIQVRVKGEAGLPTVEVFESDQEGLIFSLTPAQKTAEMPAAPAPEAPETEPVEEPETEPETEPEAVEEPEGIEAAEDEEDIELVVTATRTEEEPLNVPRSVTVITREQIEQQTNLTRDLGEILGQLTPGLAPPTERQSNFGQSLRGRNPLVLIDGVPISANETTAFSRDLRSIDPVAVERIEIVRGPTAVYGDGATGGVINIITRQPTDQRLIFRSQVGVDGAFGNLDADSFGNFFSQSISGSENNFDFFALFSRNITGTFFDAEGDVIPSADVGGSNLETIEALGKVGVNFDENQRLQLTVNHTRDDQDARFISDPTVDELPFQRKARAIEVGEQEYIETPGPGNLNTIATLAYSHENLFGSELNAQAYYRTTTLRGSFFDARLFDDPLGVSRDILEQDRWGGRLQIETPVFQAANLLWGVDYSTEDLNRDTILLDPEEFDRTGRQVLRKIGEGIVVPRHNVENLGAFAQLQWDITDRWLLSGGLRYERFGVSVPDYTNIYGDNIEGGDSNFDDVLFNAAALFRATDDLAVYANFSQGFSIPSISRILRNASEGFNFALVDINQPQKVDNYEIGLKGEWQNVQFSLAGFYNQSDLGTALVRVNPEDINLTLVRAPQRNYGVEAAIDWQPEGNWQLGGTVTWAEGEYDEDEDGEFLALRSPEVIPLKLTAYVEHQTTPGWRNRFQALYVGSRDRGFEDEIDPVPIEGYFVLDYISSIRLGPGSLQIGIENLLDNQYFTVVNQWEGGFANSFYFPARGRTIRVGYEITW